MRLSAQPPREAVLAASLLLAAAGAGCDAPAHPDADADAEAADPEVGDGGAADAERGDADAERERGGGALTLVAHTLEFVGDRLRDFDGNGADDNAIADLGEPHASIVEAVLNTAFAGQIDSGLRLAIHFPWLDDLAGPDDADALWMFLQLVDADIPNDAADDFDGAEPFYVDASSLDVCGEPIVAARGARVDGGVFEAGALRLSLPLELGAELVLSEAWFEGTVSPGGAAGDALAAGYSVIADIGRQPWFTGGELSMLEALTAGGAALGYASLPGLTPDVDVDGDGLERFVLDGGGRIETCLDGDTTPIPGRECWQDERMADGFAFAMRFQGVSARLAGREPAWEYRFAETCEGGLPEESLFDSPAYDAGACAELGEACEPLYTGGPCCDPTARCAGDHEARYVCSAPCTATRCLYGSSTPASCRPAPGLPPDQGVCVPIALWHADVDCAPGTTGCTTTYGVADGTTCLEVGDHGNFCYEICSRAPTGCNDETHLCLPLPYEDAGACVPYADPWPS